MAQIGRFGKSGPQRLLLSRNGQWNLLYFRDVSDVNANFSGLFMFAEF